MGTYFLTIDLLELYYQGPNIINKKYNFNQNINTTNTNAGYIDYTTLDGEIISLQYNKTKINGYDTLFQFKTVINDKIIDLFSIAYCEAETHFFSKPKITFYSTFFVCYENEFILEFIENFFITEQITGIRRLDIALDIPIKKSIFKKYYKTKPTTEMNFDKEKKQYETTYFGTRKNRTTHLRIYDKIKDTVKKGKTLLYDFNDYEELTRLEIEFGPDFMSTKNLYAQNIDYKKILSDRNLIRDLFFSRISLYLTYFEKVEFQKNYKVSKRKALVNNLENHLLKYEQLPRYHQNQLKSFKKYTEILGTEKFLEYVFEGNKKDIFYNLLDTTKKIFLKDCLKTTLGKKIKYNSNYSKSYREKVRTLNAIAKIIFAPHINKSDVFYIKLENLLDDYNTGKIDDFK